MSGKPTIKIGKIVTHKPIKLPLSIPHDLNEELELYAKVYEQAHGEKQAVTSLIPHMLSAFLASDHGFKKARKDMA